MANPLTTHPYAGIPATSPVKAAKVNSYKEAATRLGKRDLVKIGPHLHLKRGAGYIAVVLYETDIVRYYPHGTFSVNNGGFNTLTTTTRLNQFGPEGWRFWHDKKQLWANDLPTGHDIHYRCKRK